MESSTEFRNFTADLGYNPNNRSNDTNDGNIYSDEDYTKSFTEYKEYEVAKFINDYYLYIVCAIGIPGNIACIVTLTSMRPILSSAIYMLALAIADLIALALKMLYLQLTAKDVRLGDRLCQFIFMVGTVSQMYANWILVALTIERFIAIWFPFKVRKLCTGRNAILVLTGMLIFFILANFQFFFTFEEVSDNFLTWDCRPKAEQMAFVQFVWYWIDGILYAILPITFLLVFNGLIIFAIRRSSRKQQELTNGTGNGSENHTHQRQITTMLLTASAIFIILILPNCIFFLVKEHWTWRETSSGIAQYYLVYQIIFLLSDLSHAVNFYLYCLSGRKFRQKFFQLVYPCYRKQDGAVMRPSAHVTHARIEAAASTGTNISTITISPDASPKRVVGQVPT